MNLNLTSIISGIATAIIENLSSAIGNDFKAEAEAWSDNDQKALTSAANAVAQLRILILAGEPVSNETRLAYHATLDNLESIGGATLRHQFLSAASAHFSSAAE